MNKEFYLKARILFYLNTCKHCHIYLSIIERFNSKVPIDKRIRLVPCDRQQEFGLSDDSELIRWFEPYFLGYPALFFDGELFEGVNSIIETIASLMTEMLKDFINPEYPDYIWNKECRYEGRHWWGGKKLICE